MSANYNGQVILRFTASGSGTSSLSTLQDVISQDYTHTFSNGTGANQFSNVYRAQPTIAASSTLDLDLAGSLANAFGSTITATKLKALLIRAAAANTNDVVIGGGNTTLTLFSDLTDKLPIKPGGTFYFDAPAAAGIAIAAGSSDIVTIANSSSGSGVTFDIYIAVVD